MKTYKLGTIMQQQVLAGQGFSLNMGDHWYPLMVMPGQVVRISVRQAGPNMLCVEVEADVPEKEDS